MDTVEWSFLSSFSTLVVVVLCPVFIIINIYAFGLVGVCFLGGVLLLSSGILVGVSAPLGVTVG